MKGSSMFATENELVKDFKKQSKRFLAELFEKTIHRYFYIEEFNSSFGIADIVLGTFRPYLSKRMNRKSVDSNWVASLSAFQKNEKISVEKFMRICGVTRQTALDKLKNYTEAEFAKPIGPDMFQITNEYKTVTETVVSIEAKLKNWQRALRQANRYKKFSHLSFVLLDQRYARPAIRNLEMFRELNIGLITMDANKYDVHYVPERTYLKNSSYYLRVNEAAYTFFRQRFSVC